MRPFWLLAFGLTVLTLDGWQEKPKDTPFIISSPATFAPLKGCISDTDTIRYYKLLYDKIMWDSAYEMDMHWSYRLAAAERNSPSALRRELLEAPRTIGDGLPWPEHYLKRALDSKKLADEAKKKLDGFSSGLRIKYAYTVATFREDGRICGEAK